MQAMRFHEVVIGLRTCGEPRRVVEKAAAVNMQETCNIARDSKLTHRHNLNIFIHFIIASL